MADDVEHWLADEPVSAHREPMRTRLGRWERRHRTLVAAAGALLLTTVVALGINTLLIRIEQQKTEAQRLTAVQALQKEEQARQDRAQAQVDALLDAGPGAVPAILDNLRLDHEEVLPRLRELWEKQRLPERQLLRVGLALLPEDAGPVIRLREGMLAAEPAEMLLIRDMLAPHGQELTPDLWRLLDDPGLAPERRFRALVALARFDPANQRWPQVGEQVVEDLLGANPLHLGLWIDALRPIQSSMLEPLAKVFHGRSQGEKRQIAATILADYAADRPEMLVDLILDADERQYAVLRPLLRLHREQAVGLFRQELQKKTPREDQVNARDDLGRRQAQAAAALLQLGQAEPAWLLLRHSPDPSRRTYLLHALGRLGTDPNIILQRLEMETEVSARRALILSLGEFTSEKLSEETRRPVVARLLQWYRADPDPGIHSAVDWLLRHRRQGPDARKLDWGRSDALTRIDRELAGLPPGERGWYVNREGHTLAVVRQPEVFLMGSPIYEPDRIGDQEAPHLVRIPRSFAIAVKEVTVAQFQRFLDANPAVRRGHNYIKKYSPEDDGPITTASWFQAAQYCNWLSQQEGISEEQQCYPPIEKIGEGMELPKDYLQRIGYRLPTEAEWEYACRAGATTSRFYGSSEALLTNYAWYSKTTNNERTWPVGQGKPNDLGLFDMYGNVLEWCQDRALPYPPGESGQVSNDVEDAAVEVKDVEARVARGGAFDTQGSDLRSADRSDRRPLHHTPYFGLRVARTLR